MTFVDTILSQVPALTKPQSKFLTDLYHAFAACTADRATFLGLSRHGAGSPKRLARWFDQDIDWSMLQWTSLDHAHLDFQDAVAVLDPSFVPKSGTCTWGLDSFWSSTHGVPRRGLQVCVVGIVDLAQNTAYPVRVTQTPADLEPGTSRTAFHLECLLEHCDEFKTRGIFHVVADGEFGNKVAADAICGAGLHLVTKLRKDAHLRHLYTGPQKSAGRRRVYGERVNLVTLEGLRQVESGEAGVTWHEGVVHAKTVGRWIKLVVVRKTSKSGKVRKALLMSTELEQEAGSVVRMYRGRFQIEFVIRDAKQHMGLCEFQTRSEARIDGHVNASMWGVTMLRLEDRQEQGCEGPRVISMKKWKQRKSVRMVVDVIFGASGLEPNPHKRLQALQRLREHGLLAS